MILYMLRLFLILLCFALYLPAAKAQTSGEKIYDDEHKMVFEHSDNLYPYTYLDEKGEPAGYFIDLIDMLMTEMGIPYEIKLKPQKEALKDLKAGKADLCIGLGDIYDRQFGQYGKITLSLLTQSLVTPKKQEIKVKGFGDLKNEKVTVQDSSMCHHLMVDFGWSDNAIVSKDIRESIIEMNKTQKGQIVWNTPSLKWLMKHYELNNLKISPVDMPHGECRFISNDPYLLQNIERFYEYFYSEGKIQKLERKWFDESPEPEPEAQWHWYLAGFGVLLLIGAIALLLLEVHHNRKATRKYHEQTKNLTEMAQHNKYRFWTYSVGEHKFIWHNEQGAEIKTYTTEEFAKRYNQTDFELLKEAMGRLINQHKDAHGHDEQEEELELRARDTEFGDVEKHGFVVHLSVLSRDHNHKPTIIIGTKKDVTKEMDMKQRNQELSLRYLSMFYNNESGILIFDHDGILQNANQKACELLAWDVDEMVKKNTSIKTIIGPDNKIKILSDLDGMKGIYTGSGRAVDYQVKTISNENDELLGLYVFCI